MDKVLLQLSIWNLSVSPQDDSRQLSRMSARWHRIFFNHSSKLDYQQSLGKSLYRNSLTWRQAWLGHLHPSGDLSFKLATMWLIYGIPYLHRVLEGFRVRWLGVCHIAKGWQDIPVLHTLLGLFKARDAHAKCIRLNRILKYPSSLIKRVSPA